MSIGEQVQHLKRTLVSYYIDSDFSFTDAEKNTISVILENAAINFITDYNIRNNLLSSRLVYSGFHGVVYDEIYNQYLITVMVTATYGSNRNPAEVAYIVKYPIGYIIEIIDRFINSQ